MSSPVMVPMFAPDGTFGEIPQERMNDAIKAGGKSAVEMVSPDGSRGYIPHDRVFEAVRAGAKPYANTVQTQFEKDRPGGSMSTGQQAVDFIKSIGRNLTSPPAGVQPGGYPAIQYQGQGKGFTDNPALDPKQIALQQGKEQDEARKTAGYSSTYRLAAALSSALPMNATGAEQAATQGRTGAVLGHTVGTPAALAVVGKVVSKGAGTLENMGATPSENLIAALKPSGKVAPKVKAAIETAAPELQNIASTDAPKSLPDLHNSLQKVSLGIESKFQGLLKPNETLQVSTDPIAQRIQSVIDKRPEQAAALQPLVDKYRGKQMSLGELNARRPDVSGVEGTGIRDVLYSELQRLYPNENISGLKQSQSALMTIQDAAKKRIGSLITPDATVAARPLQQRVINEATSMHVTRPATIPLAVWRLLKPKMPSDLPNTQVDSAMGKLNR